MRTTGPSTRRAIESYILRFGTRTIPQIALATGHSYNTVKYILNEMGAEKVPDTYPQQYRAGTAQVVEGVVPRLNSNVPGDIDIVMSVQTHDEWIKRWNDRRIAFTKGIGQLKIEPDDDPAQLAEHLTVGAQSIAALAYALQQVKDLPDWYEILGGVHDQEA